jgi:hypothetical protein
MWRGKGVGRWLRLALPVAVGLSTPGCAGFDGHYDAAGKWRYDDPKQAVDDQINAYNNWFSSDSMHHAGGSR